MELTLTLALGALIGIVMGVTGAGGGVLAMPALLFGLHLSMQQAAPLAARGQQLVVAALASAQPQEAMREDVAFQEGVELVLD